MQHSSVSCVLSIRRLRSATKQGWRLCCMIGSAGGVWRARSSICGSRRHFRLSWALGTDVSTEAQVAQLVAPFLDRHPEFVRVGRSLVRPPAHHLQTGFDLQRQASKGSVYPIWFAGITFGPPPHFGVGVGQAVQRAVGHLGDPDIRERLLMELEVANVAFLDRFTSLDLLLEPEAVGYTGLPMMRFIRALILAPGRGG